MHPAKESLVRAFERHRDIHDAEHDVHFGLLLSGSLRVQCGSYRDKLAADAGIAAQGTWTRDHGPDAQLAPIVGGEMEGLGLLAISSVDTPRWIIVKGISDFADGKDQDLFKARRTLACANSARFVLRALIAEESERGAA
jgi:adenosylhomocysteine nucleosidase